MGLLVKSEKLQSSSDKKKIPPRSPVSQSGDIDNHQDYHESVPTPQSSLKTKIREEIQHHS